MCVCVYLVSFEVVLHKMSISALKNGEASSSVNHPDPEMTQVYIPEDFLTKVYLGRCSNVDKKYACSSPESQYTDFNIWDRFLSTEELIKWTSCQ